MKIDKRRLVADLTRWDAGSPQPKRLRRSAGSSFRIPSWVYIAIGLLIVSGVVGYGLERDARRFGSYDLALRHRAAAPNCAAARVFGVAPARRGEPGYYATHDADGDGVACEPFRRF